MAQSQKWIDFERFVSRHGEHAVVGLLETVERREGIRHGDEPLDLEIRWNAVMNFASPQVAA
jgi:hypothetical protein